MRPEPKIIELNGKRWKIGFFNPMTGNFIALKMLSKIGHVAAAIASGAVTDKTAIFMEVSQALGSFSQTEFVTIQTEALKVCSLLVSAGETEVPNPVLLNDGRWGVDDLESDALTIMALTCHALTVNLLPFFEGNRLKSIMDSFKGYTLPFAV